MNEHGRTPGRSGRGRAFREAPWLLTTLLVTLLLIPALPATAADGRHRVTGLVLSVDAASRSFVVSHDDIPGLMEAMTMAFEVREAGELRDLAPGATVEFTLEIGERFAYATAIEVHAYAPVHQDPLAAHRLALLRRVARGAHQPATAAPGERLPDFALIDQARRPVALSALRGKVVALNFMYTRCALPQFCLRATNNLSVLRKRFSERLGDDLVLLTITFDPLRDGPDVLAAYARQWDADGQTWRFLTGEVAEVRRVAAIFGVDYFPDEGLLNHSMRTAVIDRSGRLVASIAGNAFTAAQLGDLVATVLAQDAGGTR